ncbi:MAG: hypothetical protein WC812_02770 [Candidatus Pacearchaeota archaeon]|jgi:hypothetical protein
MNKKIKKIKDEEIELAEQHIELAEQLVSEKDKKAKEQNNKLLKDAAFCLEADLEEYSE